MKFDPPLTEVRLVRRYKRFLADVEFSDGEIITVHCANPGSMMGLTDPGIRAWISDSRNPKRKLRYSLEMVEANNTVVGINTAHPNRLAIEALSHGVIPELSTYDNLYTEKRYGENSRIDILLTRDTAPDIYVEVKNVHFVRTPGLHEFPDSVTARGAKHLYEMAREVEKGNRAAMLYVIQRNDGDRLRLANDLDPAYVEAFQHATACGVEAYAVGCDVSPNGIDPVRPVTIEQLNTAT
ncbi:MAG: DNA/RNA nuclease SfsA [Rhizobiaceae bacterium]|nr:DNA/RNA nuclease SfsA [Rhizobiaceae bacterium]